ncbi:MAG: 6-carboxytetrahydropterin synthase [Bacteroidetes bacterium]|jgi:6-pyruvoyltetrahydropterin/6-carboxytetrahydropterin synthase|nr:6-carboxytetrahydropterin synthase [Bacteroidota bacterium]
MMTVTRRETFSASHRLYNPAFSDAQNEAVFDKCNNPNGHGHNYELEVTVEGPVHPDTGYVVDLKQLKEVIRREVIAKVDHKHLNHDVEFLRGVIPTAENIALAIWKVLAERIPSGQLVSVRLRETENNVVEVRGGK